MSLKRVSLALAMLIGATPYTIRGKSAFNIDAGPDNSPKIPAKPARRIKGIKKPNINQRKRQRLMRQVPQRIRSKAHR